MLKTVIEVNALQRIGTIRKLGKHMDDLRGRKITVLGLAIKSGDEVPAT